VLRSIAPTSINLQGFQSSTGDDQPQKDNYMPKVCGIELKSSEAILVVVDNATGTGELINTEPKKIKIGDDEDSAEVRSFHEAIVEFIRDNNIDVIVVKKRAKKGKMAGGPVSFKLEALIQLNGVVDTGFVTGQGIAAAHKKDKFEIPIGLNKYQETAFMAACLYIRKNA